jgi:hypothetical protein
LTDEEKTRRSEADAELEREIRKERKFTLAEGIGRLAGPGSMKGTSPVSRSRINPTHSCHLDTADSGGNTHVTGHFSKNTPS